MIPAQPRATTIFWVLPLLIGLGFVALWLQLAPLARLAADDFCALHVVHQHGPLGAVWWWHQNWAGRWAGYGIIGLATLGSEQNGAVGVWNGALLSFCVGALWLLIGRIAERAELQLRTWQSGVLALASAALFYAISPDRAQVWFWLSGAAMHLLPLALASLGAAFLLPEKPRPAESVGAAVCALLLAGLSEATLVVVAAAWLVGLAWSARHEPEALRTRAWPLLALLVGAILTFSAPGLWLRAGTESGHAASVGKLALALAHTYRVALETNAFVPAIALASGAALGVILRPQKRLALWWLLGFLALSLLTQVPAVWAFQGHAPPRSWVPTIALWLSAVVLLGWCLAPREPKLAKVTVAVGAFSWLLLLPFLWYMQTVEVPQARQATAAFDRNFALMLEQKKLGRRETLTLPNLPHTDAVLLGEPMPQAQHWISGCLRDGLDLPYDVRRDHRALTLSAN